MSWLGRAFGVAVLAVVPVGLALGAFGSESLRHELAEGGVPCPFKLATGIRCPFCGITHATLSLGRGDFAEALWHHPLAPVVLALIVWGGILLVRDRPATVFGRRLRALPILLTVGVIWAVNLLVHVR